MQNKRNTCTLEFEPEMRCTHKMLGLFSADCSFSPPFPPPPLVCSFFDSSREWECEWAAQNGGNVKPLCTLGGRNKNSNTRNSTSSTLLHPNTSLLLLCLVQNRCFRFVFLPLLRFCCPLRWQQQQRTQYTVEPAARWPKGLGQIMSQSEQARSQLYNLTLRFAAFPL